MLYDGANIIAVVNALKTWNWGSDGIPPLVCDPVCVSTSGHTLLRPDAVEVMIKEMFPISRVVTPNISEAELVLRHLTKSSSTFSTSTDSDKGIRIDSLESMLFASQLLHKEGSHSVLLKGGHLTFTTQDVDTFSSAHPEVVVVRDFLLHKNMEILRRHGPPSVDSSGASSSGSLGILADLLLESNGDVTIFARPRIDTKNTHGTGCTLSAAICCELARGRSRTCRVSSS
jgi:hydroxymethylpyrimidine/phosphomethylpyrimidine kinase / thiaminase